MGEEEDDAYAASEATTDFMARLRIAIMADQAPAPTEEEGRPTDIVFLHDVIARHAKLDWYPVEKNIISERDLYPPEWSRKRPAAKDDMKSIVYLTCPVQLKQGWQYLSAISSFFRTDWQMSMDS